MSATEFRDDYDYFDEAVPVIDRLRHAIAQAERMCESPSPLLREAAAHALKGYRGRMQDYERLGKDFLVYRSESDPDSWLQVDPDKQPSGWDRTGTPPAMDPDARAWWIKHKPSRPMGSEQ